VFKLSSHFNAFYNRLPVPARNLTASLYAAWSARVKYGGEYQRWRRFLRESQWWSEEQVRVYQAEQLEKLLKFVHAECAFYRRVMEQAGVKPTDSDPFGALRRLPRIDRAVVKSEYAGIRTRFGTDSRLTLSTSGTTGASLHVPMTSATMQREYAFRWQYYSVAGAERGSRFAFFQGHMVVPLSRRNPPFHIRNFAENTAMFSLYHMEEALLPAYVEGFNQFAPEFVYGYPSGIYVLAAFAKKHGLRLHRPRALFTASEMLHEFQQRLLEEVFQCEIFQWYGQVETTVNLHECEKHRFHVKEEYGLLELVDANDVPAAAGQVADVVGTGWGNPAFPLLRYDTGDNMVLSPETRCACGRSGRIIERILGRDDDFIVTPSGSHVGRLDFVFKAVDTVRESQIVQETFDSVVIRVVPLPGYSSRDEQTLIAKLRERIGSDTRVRVEECDRIPRGASGKFRYVVSKVTTDLVRQQQSGV
jgi:phenylacetate-CoA ligase